jgi:hypothetical protein
MKLSRLFTNEAEGDSRLATNLESDMAIHRRLESFACGPEEVRCIVKAYYDALLALGLASRDDPATRLIAKKIIEIAQTGERDPIKIRRRAIEKLGTSRVRCKIDRSGLR